MQLNTQWERKKVQICLTESIEKNDLDGSDEKCLCCPKSGSWFVFGIQSTSNEEKILLSVIKFFIFC